MKQQANFTEVRNNGKPIADIVPLWKRRTAQPLVLGGESVSRMILDERNQSR